MKLSKTQQETLGDFKKDSFLHFMPYMGSFNPSAYYFMSGTMKRYRYSTVQKLITLGYLETFAEEVVSGKHKVRPTTTQEKGEMR